MHIFFVRVHLEVKKVFTVKSEDIISTLEIKTDY